MTGELFLHGGDALTMGPSGVVKSALVHVRDGRIVEVASGKTPPAGARVVDTRNCLVLPGFVNGHAHSGMTLFRGSGDDLPLKQWLSERIFPLEQKWGTREGVAAATRLAALEMIRAGTTTFNDMYYFEEEVARVADEAGLRCIAGQTIVEISGVGDDPARVLGELDAFLDAVKNYPRVWPAVTPHSVYGVGGPMWEKVIRYVADRNLLLHTHLAETQEEMDECRKRYGMTPTELLDERGAWDLRASAAHGVCLTPPEIAILGKKKVGVIHNPGSNLKLGTRIAPVVELRRAGVPVGLGTDGVASNNNLDLIEEARLAAQLQSFLHGPGALRAEDTVRLLTIEGARALGVGDEIGSLEPGKRADVIALDLDKPNAVPLYHPFSHVVYSAAAGDVKHVVVEGTVLMEDYRVRSLDEKAVLDESRAWAKRIG